MSDNSDSKINNLNNYIHEIISLLEEDLERLKANKKHTIKSKKTITDVLIN
ncbi:MAG: hypothetical protein RCG15_01520 [Candidatus Rickettsia vulgarisii]